MTGRGGSRAPSPACRKRRHALRVGYREAPDPPPASRTSEVIMRKFLIAAGGDHRRLRGRCCGHRAQREPASGARPPVRAGPRLRPGSRGSGPRLRERVGLGRVALEGGRGGPDAAGGRRPRRAAERAGGRLLHPSHRLSARRELEFADRSRERDRGEHPMDARQPGERLQRLLPRLRAALPGGVDLRVLRRRRQQRLPRARSRLPGRAARLRSLHRAHERRSALRHRQPQSGNDPCTATAGGEDRQGPALRSDGGCLHHRRRPAARRLRAELPAHRSV